jgi:hypothetical protein
VLVTTYEVQQRDINSAGNNIHNAICRQTDASRDEEPQRHLLTCTGRACEFVDWEGNVSLLIGKGV